MSEERRDDREWQHVMDYADEIAYEANALIIPTGYERLCARLDDLVLFVGDRVKHVSGKFGIIDRIVWWNRCRDGGYFVVHYETADAEYLNDIAENFEITGADFPASDMEIPF